ncbi:MAG: hypothetical protein ACPLIG_00850 [Candidatus Bathyarchaeales archaeon]
MKFSVKSLIQFIKRSKKTILLIVIVSGLTLFINTSVSILLSSYHNTSFPSVGTIHVIGLEAYGGDLRITEDGQQYLYWGTVYPGAVVHSSFYVKSKSNIPVTLSLSVSNFVFKNSLGTNITVAPPISEPLSVTWSYDNTPLGTGESFYVTLSLKATSDVAFLTYVLDNNVKEFAFDISIKALPLE